MVQPISRNKALEQLGSSWQMIAQQALTDNVPLSVLSMYTMRPLTSEVFNLLEKELRSSVIW